VITPNRREPDAGDKVAAETTAARNLRRRIASALVLAPVAIAAAYVGGWLFFCLCAVAAGLILWEWTWLVARAADLRILLPGSAALLAAMALTKQSQAGAAISMIVIGAMLAGGAVAAWPRRYPAANPATWAAAGVLYAGVALLGPVLLRGDPEWGFAALLFLFATVWATDICAYLVGRAIGGPLLWPALSPHKTWAGAIGGLVGGVAAGTLVAYASVGIKPAVAGVLALILSVVTQSGDLLESAIKRRFGVKDAGRLIPGHGGVMDRLDGFLAAALAAALIGSVHQGLAAPARGLLVW
jgi:phosphatidate cytidylyltransferase